MPRFLDSFSDGASAHSKNNASILNLVHHRNDFGLDACWTFTATGHGKGAGDGIVASGVARNSTVGGLSPQTISNFLQVLTNIGIEMSIAKMSNITPRSTQKFILVH